MANSTSFSLRCLRLLIAIPIYTPHAKHKPHGFARKLADVTACVTQSGTVLRILVRNSGARNSPGDGTAAARLPGVASGPRVRCVGYRLATMYAAAYIAASASAPRLAASSLLRLCSCAHAVRLAAV